VPPTFNLRIIQVCAATVYYGPHIREVQECVQHRELKINCENFKGSHLLVEVRPFYTMHRNGNDDIANDNAAM